jgi:dynein intermediate chain 2
MPKHMQFESYIWNLANPNEPEITLCPPSPLCTIAFNHKNSDILVGGSYNGSLSFFDLRECNTDKKCTPTESTVLEKSHHDPVYDVYWLTHAKTGDELVSTSTDGRLLWWDRKKLSEPIDELVVSEVIGDNEEAKVLGCTRIEYNQEPSPMKYLAGTEQGYIFLANKKPGKAVEIIQRFGLNSGKHHGPIYALQRNPFAPKYFLSIGDWTAKVWSEEIKTPLMQTKYHDSYLTDGCWSPQRPGLFYLTRMDGFIDIWDFYYRQNEVAYSQKISDNPLTCISINGSRAAIGDSEGSITLMSLCPSLYEMQPNEKEEMVKIFDREAAREKNLELAKKQADSSKKPAKGGKEELEEKKRKQLEKELLDIEEKFYRTVGIDDGEAIGGKGNTHQSANSKKDEESDNDEPQTQKAPEPKKATPPKEETKKEPEVKADSDHEKQATPTAVADKPTPAADADKPTPQAADKPTPAEDNKPSEAETKKAADTPAQAADDKSASASNNDQEAEDSAQAESDGAME